MRHRRALLACLGAFLAGAVVAGAGLTLQPAVQGPVGPGTVSIDPSVRGGDTVVEIPPLGQIRANSHDGPLGFTARVDRIDFERAGRLAGDLARGVDPGAQLRGEIQDDLRPMLLELAAQSVAVAVVGGVVVGFLLPRRRVRYVVSSVAGAVSFVAVVGGVAFASFVPASFDQPEFEGTLAGAPDVVSTVQRHIDDVGVVESRLASLSDRLVTLYHSVEGTGAPTSDVVLLHVSDLHSNPVGVELVGETARRFDVDAVIDTGDITSFGSSIEELIVNRIARIDVPYHVVPGNHDHDSIRNALTEAGVSVLDPGEVEIGGVRILGVGEPTFTADNEVPESVWDMRLEASAEQIAEQVRTRRPDVVAVHNPVQLRDALGSFDVGLAGHRHRAVIEYHEGTVLVEAGSAGATGVGALMEESDLPYQMQLLRFEDDRLVAVDRLEFQGIDGAFRLERVLIDPSRVDGYPDAEPVPPSSGPLGPLYRLDRGPR